MQNYKFIKICKKSMKIYKMCVNHCCAVISKSDKKFFELFMKQTLIKNFVVFMIQGATRAHGVVTC